MKLNWDKVKKEYPKAFKKFNESFSIDLTGGFISACYCDLEKFFDDNELIICIGRNYITTPNNVDLNYYGKNKYSYHILQQGVMPKTEVNGIETRDEAKEQAIYKAFEILENKLKEK